MDEDSTTQHKPQEQGASLGSWAGKLIKVISAT